MPYNILIVDDDLGIREALGEYLKSKGYAVKTAANGNEAVEMVMGKRFDVVLTDLVMPGMDGMQLAKAVKELDPEAMVIMMTGYGSLESAIDAIKEGAYDYLTKPFKLEEIAITVKNACEKLSLRRQQKIFIDELRRAHDKGGGAAGEGHKDSVPAYADDRSALTELERLARLMDQGMLTREEFDILKQRYLKEELA